MGSIPLTRAETITGYKMNTHKISHITHIQYSLHLNIYVAEYSPVNKRHLFNHRPIIKSSRHLFRKLGLIFLESIYNAIDNDGVYTKGIYYLCYYS